MPLLDERFIVDAFTPAYTAVDMDQLEGRAAAAVERLRECRACPRACGANRLDGETAVCATGRYARVSSAFAHFGEENCLRGSGGSGTIFFARCNLRCVFCQNWDISQADAGRDYRPAQLAQLMLSLQEQGCHNVNLVTPEHVVPQVVQALHAAVAGGLRIPVVYNTSGYDSVETLRELEGLVDIYMPDFKLWSPGLCARYLGARDYGERARDAIREMHRQVGELVLRRDGTACRGLLVRHLVMPGLIEETRQILTWIGATISRDTAVNIMGQYRPDFRVGTVAEGRVSDGPFFTEIDRRPTPQEIRQAYQIATGAGLYRFA